MRQHCTTRHGHRHAAPRPRLRTPVSRAAMAGLALLIVTSVGVGADLQRAPLGEWSIGCTDAFRLAAMPSAWTFCPQHETLYVITHVAIDFDRLPEAARAFVAAIEEELGAPVAIVSSGPRREETMLRAGEVLERILPAGAVAAVRSRMAG